MTRLRTATFLLISFTLFACTAQKAEKGEATTGPLVVTATFERTGGGVVDLTHLHPLVISRDSRGGLSEVKELFGTLKVKPAGPDVVTTIEVPRDLIAQGKEFSFALNPPGRGFPAPLRRDGAMLTFKVDDATKRIDLGRIAIE